MEERTQYTNHHVFISSSSKNKSVADAIAADFEQHGVKCWYAPRDILPGQAWMGSIVDAIKKAEIIVLIYTDDSNSSPQVMREMTIAFENGKTIVPFRLSDTDMNENLSYFLTGVHWLDAITPPLSKHIVNLREKIRSMLTNPPVDSKPYYTSPYSYPVNQPLYQGNQTSYQGNQPLYQGDSSYVDPQLSARMEPSASKKRRNVIVISSLCFLCAVALVVFFIIKTKPSSAPVLPGQAGEITSEKVEASTPVQTETARLAATTESDPDLTDSTLIDSGSAGDTCEWNLYSNGVLEIAGTGKMDDCIWDIDNQKVLQPWDIYHDLITSVIIDDGIKYIGECSFRQCYRVTSVRIPKSVTSIGWCAFTHCGGLQKFVVDAENKAFCSVDGVLFNKSMTTLLIYPSSKPGNEYTVPDGVTMIDTFEYCDLKTIHFPDSVTKIDSSAFSGCDRIEEFVFPSNVTSISSYMFWGCDMLKTVTIPSSVEYISFGAFGMCDNLKDVYYGGTPAQWNNITIDEENDVLKKVKIHCQ